MINSYYTFRALVDEWAGDLRGCVVEDAFSQVKNELSLAVTGDSSAYMLRCSVQRPLIYLFRTEGVSKARRNVATLFEAAFGREVTALRIAERDRMVYLDLSDGSHFLWQLFGSRANVFLVNASGTIAEAFQSSTKHAGTEPPAPQPAPMPETPQAFEDRWRPNRRTTRQVLQSVVTLFGPDLARETVHRARLPDAKNDDPESCTAADRRALFEASLEVRRALDRPAPRIYGEGQFPDAFSLIDLKHRAGETAERFDTVGHAVQVYVRRALAEKHFHRLYDSLESSLEEAAEHYRTSAERMMEELSSESRAGRYERWGHLLMAQKDEVPDGAEEVTLPDLFEEGEPVTIPLDPSKNAIENAEHYYRRARRTRRSREEAEDRLDDTLELAERAETLRDEIRDIETLDEIKRFRKEREADIAPFVGQSDEDVSSFPFRRFDLGDGFEVWVGKNARQNDELTFHTAQKYDLWLHARGVPGSHTVLHKPNRDAEPGHRRKVIAAAIAAYYSKARGSGAVPVMITERKYVRSPKGSPPGAVRVDHEENLLVEPGLPE